jgi:hypothetical protein
MFLSAPALRGLEKEHFLAVKDLGKPFFKVDFGPKNSRNRRLPPPPYSVFTAFSTIKLA